METLSKMTPDDLRDWLLEKEMPMEVADAFDGRFHEGLIIHVRY